MMPGNQICRYLDGQQHKSPLAISACLPAGSARRELAGDDVLRAGSALILIGTSRVSRKATAECQPWPRRRGDRGRGAMIRAARDRSRSFDRRLSRWEYPRCLRPGQRSIQVPLAHALELVGAAVPELDS